MKIVFIHGAGCTPAAFGSFVERFDGALAPALPGRCGDQRDAGSVDDFADAIAAFASKTFDGRDFVLCGHSMGGAVALDVALRGATAVPGVRGVIALDSGSRLRVAPALFERLEADFAAASLELATLFFAESNGARIEAAANDMTRVGRAQTIRDFRACDAFDAGARLHELSVPLLAITGERDAMTPPKYAQSLADRVPSGSARIIAGAGHFAMIERPDDVAGAIADFAAALEPQR